MKLCDHREEILLSLLRRATATASAQELAAALKSDARSIRALIQHLRADHCAPICSTPADGFWYARTREDVERTVAQIRSRVIELEKTSAGILAGGDWLFGEEGTGQMGLGL